MALALLRTAGGPPESFSFGSREITLGRDPSNIVILDHPSVSRFHAKLSVLNGAPVVIDLNSTHGTWVNRRRIAGPTYLTATDVMSIGPTEFRLQGVAEERTAPPGPPPMPVQGQQIITNQPVAVWPLVVHGQNSRLEVFPDRVRIVRAGLGSFMLHGLKGDKELFIRAITGLQFKRCGTITVGYLQFTVPGGVESNKGILDAVADENTISFLPHQEAAFEHAKRVIDDLIAHYHAPTPAVSVAPVSPADELAKLAELFRQGILTQDEFQRAKARLGF